MIKITVSTLLACLSILVIVGVILSYTTRPVINVSTWYNDWAVIICWNGKVSILHTVHINNADVDTMINEAGWQMIINSPSAFRLLGFYWHDFPVYLINNTPTVMHRRLDIPLWAMFILFAFYPCIVLWFGPMRRIRRKKQGCCIQCGYNLLNNISGICPECGKKIFD